MNSELRKLPLSERHIQKGARMGDLFGWRVPLDYGSPRVELRHIEEDVALIDFTFMTLLRVEGADRHDYLNRRLSQKTLGMCEGDGCRAALLDAGGKMEADLEVFARNDDFLLLAPPFEGDALLNRLDQYVFSEDCRFTDITAEAPLFALVGPRWRQVLETLQAEPPLTPPRYWSGARAHGENLELFLSAHIPQGCFIRGDDVGMAGLLWGLRDAIEGVGGALAGWSAFDAWRIMRRRPWWGSDLDHDTIPLEAGLRDALHFDKGCYPGQETIARISNLGHPARQLVAVEYAGATEVPVGTELTTADGRKAGRLTSATTLLPRRATLGLAMVKWPLRQPGTELHAGDCVFKVLPAKESP
ncbi:MAG: hypothetical protein PWP23_134 [Candidatus Sumerlaeota bacterium]|nr:hypothetical protein [Candidatus Sumerlaeota bacterium]